MALTNKLHISHALIALLFIMFQYGECHNKSFLQKSKNLKHKHNSDSKNYYESIESENNNSSCEAVFQDYKNVLYNFTACELSNARPFRLCISCSAEYEAAKSFYKNLTEDSKHVDCKIKYMLSDRVMIVPTVQENIDKIWGASNCQNCFQNDPNWLKSREDYRPDVKKFLELYDNFTTCVNVTDGEDQFNSDINSGNTSSSCSMCGRNYTLLNEHYNSMYSSDSGDVCMDIVDRMNFSRILWNLHMKCNHREGSRDALPVILISCFVGCTPFIFYVSLKVTGKVGSRTIFKQKRLLGSQENSGGGSECVSDSTGEATGAGDISKHRNTTAD